MHDLAFVSFLLTWYDRKKCGHVFLFVYRYRTAVGKIYLTISKDDKQDLLGIFWVIALSFASISSVIENLNGNSRTIKHVIAKVKKTIAWKGTLLLENQQNLKTAKYQDTKLEKNSTFGTTLKFFE